MDKEEGKKSLEQFISDYGVVFWTDDYGSTLVFLNQDYVPSVECAKPVVYLYPERTMEVSVKVGARVTKSEPYYGAGWQAIARPNGQLLVGGQTYDSLFWEGLGYGSYPEITEGVIVARPQVEETIRSQLTLIGLKDKEVNDFLTFWLPKMPATNYVRLTWLTNQQMEALAPLSVSPKPDSLIRVFLDFQGLKQPINLKKQELQKYERKGFTVVEWGGLLRK